MLDYGRMTNIT